VTTNNTPTLGALIRARREILGVSRAELARRVRIDRSQLSRWENGDATPAGDSWRRLARALGIPLAELRATVPATSDAERRAAVVEAMRAVGYSESAIARILADLESQEER